MVRMKLREKTARYDKLVVAFGLSSAVNILLFLIRVFATDSSRYWFLLWNLTLAWVPLFLAWALVNLLRRLRWSDWRVVGLTALWVVFLPNSFYTASDLVHLGAISEVGLLYDIALFSLFIFNGFALGYTSLFLVHRELATRFKPRIVLGIIGGVLLLCSFAIYLGRYLRWNTWDLVFNPTGLLIDVSDRIINPAAHGTTFEVTAVFFVLLATIYYVLWQAEQYVRAAK